MASGGAGSVVIGYVVLTAQPDGSWRDDWDGEVHVDRDAAIRELLDARDSGITVKLAALYEETVYNFEAERAVARG